MEIIRARNVNDAYRSGRALLDRIGILQTSRAGDVLVAPCPVTTIYENPQERVLMDERRDANPFFHLNEAIWMLAGSDDARWLDIYVRDFSQRFAEDDGRQYGAYGKRWRSGLGQDQLEHVVALLRVNHDDRRVVLQMWSSVFDLDVDAKDVPCNLVVAPRIRTERTVVPAGDWYADESEDTVRSVLDITVFCRSNDIIYGAYGANAVHFSVLQEYLAAAIGVGIGRYYQVSNNWHGYVDVLKKTDPETDDMWLNPYDEAWIDDGHRSSVSMHLRHQPMVSHPQSFLEDCETWVRSRDTIRGGAMVAFGNDWFTETLVPMELAHAAWRNGDFNNALGCAERIVAPDWRAATLAWLGRRKR